MLVPYFLLQATGEPCTLPSSSLNFLPHPLQEANLTKMLSVSHVEEQELTTLKALRASMSRGLALGHCGGTLAALASDQWLTEPTGQ